jgi:hypothetical protein
MKHSRGWVLYGLRDERRRQEDERKKSNQHGAERSGDALLGVDSPHLAPASHCLNNTWTHKMSKNIDLDAVF